MANDRISNILRTLGPGILFASTAIGVSHLVQSTRAGAIYGFGLIGAVILANLFKYPFFEYGSRYANATGESIIDGYRRLGKPMLWTYFLITVGTMFFVAAAVGIVTAGFMDNLFGVGNLQLVTVVLFAACLIVLLSGRYKILDSATKVIGAVLLLSTLAAFVFTLLKGPQTSEPLWVDVDYTDIGTFGFLIALMGWMPTAVDMSTWNSLWTIERIKQTGYHPSLKQTLLDFNFGYIASAVLSICFVTMGAFILFETNTELPASGAAFANSVVGMYTNAIGDWSYFIIATAAFSIMLGTCIAIFDGYARALERTSELLFLEENQKLNEKSKKRFYAASLIITAVGALTVIWITVFNATDTRGFKLLVDLATTLSFLVAPVIAIANFRLVTRKDFPESSRPRGWLRILSFVGIIFLFAFTLLFLFYYLPNQ